MQHPAHTAALAEKQRLERKEKVADLLETTSNTAIGFTYNWLSLMVLFWLAETYPHLRLDNPEIYATVAGINATAFHFIRHHTLRRLFRKWGLAIVDKLKIRK